MSTPEALPPQFAINLPPENIEGHYADFAGVWHTPETFVLDFSAVSGPPQAVENEAGQKVAQIKAQIVTRVRIPASQAFEVMKALNAQLSLWETEQAAARQARGEQPPAAAEE